MRKDSILIKNEFDFSNLEMFFPKLGHSIFQMTGIGIIQKIGENVKGFNLGERVVWIGGRIRETIEVSQKVVTKIPEDLPNKKAIFAGAGAYISNNIRESNFTFGEKVLVYGNGLLGKIASQVLSLFGCYPQEPMDSDGGNADGAIICAFNNLDFLRLLAKLRKKGMCIILNETDCVFPVSSFQEKAIRIIFATIPGGNSEGFIQPIGYKPWPLRREMSLMLKFLLENKIKTEEFRNDE